MFLTLIGSGIFSQIAEFLGENSGRVSPDLAPVDVHNRADVEVHELKNLIILMDSVHKTHSDTVGSREWEADGYCAENTLR